MKESYLFDMSFNNVVFADRNKVYGAYELRKDYSKHVVAAALVAITIFTVSLGWPLVMQQNVELTLKDKPEIKKDDVITIIGDNLPSLPPAPEPKTQSLPAVKTEVRTIRVTPPKVVPDTHPTPEEMLPTAKELEGAIIGTSNQQGEATTQLNLLGIEGEGSGSMNDASPTERETIYEFVENMPYFEGGEAGLMRYIAKKIRYPRQAVTEQVEGVVVVSFVVDQYGRVTNATTLKEVGYGMDEEALRVINALPDWTPGKQNGKPVAVRYTLPIRFNLKR